MQRRWRHCRFHPTRSYQSTRQQRQGTSLIITRIPSHGTVETAAVICSHSSEWSASIDNEYDGSLQVKHRTCQVSRHGRQIERSVDNPSYGTHYVLER
jgi:hypothetical protein